MTETTGNSETTTTTPRDRITNSDSVDPLSSESAQFYDAHDALEADGVYATAVQKVQSQRLETEHRQDNVPGTTTTTTVPQGDVKGEKHEDQHDTQSLTIKERDHEYFKMIPQFFFVYLQVFCIFLGFLSMYWGSIYHRDQRYRNVGYLVVNEDSQFQVPNGSGSASSSTVEPYLGNAMLNMLTNNKTIENLGDFQIVNLTDFTQLAKKHNNTILEEVQRQVHHQKYWGAIYIAPNSTQNIYQGFSTGNASYMQNVNQSITVVYETGRHFSALSQYLNRNLNLVSEAWIRDYASSQVYQPILGQLNSTQREYLLSNNQTIAIFTTLPTFNFIDQRPSPSPAVLGPSEIQLIYCLIISFYSYNFSKDIYAYMRKKIKYRSYLFYKFLISQLHAFVLALVYSLMAIAFQIPTSVAFGKSGFLVLWMFIFLYISATGVINEVVVLIILTFGKQQLIAPWMVFNIVANVSTTFAPFVLTPGFFRFGYALPMYNAYEAVKVVFFDTWKGHLGRNLGVLIIWIVVGNVSLLFVSHWSTQRAKKIALAEKQKKKEQQQVDK